MKTTTLSPSKRKIINLDDATFNMLSIMATEEGTNLKNFIEHLLSDIAKSYEDSRLYTKLCSKKRPTLRSGLAYEYRFLKGLRKVRKKVFRQDA